LERREMRLVKADVCGFFRVAAVAAVEDDEEEEDEDDDAAEYPNGRLAVVDEVEAEGEGREVDEGAEEGAVEDEDVEKREEVVGREP